ncbi:MAG TPA: hypothetical protein VJU61_20685, partial [Polyangiaceae bacterium]|nr:hypothetical protein [Polyangiaceae bacterium]
MKYTLVPSARARSLAERMSLREAFRQVCCPLLSFEPTETIGGAHIPRGTREKIAGQAEALRAVCKVPP